jgi:hypothetical protein
VLRYVSVPKCKKPVLCFTEKTGGKSGDKRHSGTIVLLAVNSMLTNEYMCYIKYF